MEPDLVTLGEVEYRRPQELTLYRYRYALIPELLPEDLAQMEWSVGHYEIGEPLVILPDQRVVDGQHRLKIALKKGIERVPVRVGTFADEYAIEWYALQTMLARGQLTPARKLQLAEPLARAEAEEARQRQASTLKQFQARLAARPADTPAVRGKVLARIAEKIDMSVRTAERIKAVLDNGPPAVVARLLRGELRPGAAYNQTMEALKAKDSDKSPRSKRGRPAPHAAPPAAPPPRPRMPASTLAALKELYTRVTGWIEVSGRWTPKDQAAFWKGIELLLSHLDDLLNTLNQYVRDVDTHPVKTG